MKKSFALAIGIALLLAGCGKESDKPAQSTNAVDSNKPLDAPANYLGALSKAQQLAIKTVDVASLTQAIQMYQVDNGGFPKSLQELVDKKYMPKLPDAPYGMKLDYDPATGKVKVVKQ